MHCSYWNIFSLSSTVSDARFPPKLPILEPLSGHPKVIEAYDLSHTIRVALATRKVLDNLSM